MKTQGTKRRGLLWAIGVGVMTPVVLAVGALAFAALLAIGLLRATRSAALKAAAPAAARRPVPDAPVAALLAFEAPAPAERLDTAFSRAA